MGYGVVGCGWVWLGVVGCGFYGVVSMVRCGGVRCGSVGLGVVSMVR